MKMLNTILNFLFHRLMRELSLINRIILWTKMEWTEMKTRKRLRMQRVM